jgi:hypothetical protein
VDGLFDEISESQLELHRLIEWRAGASVIGSQLSACRVARGSLESGSPRALAPLLGCGYGHVEQTRAHGFESAETRGRGLPVRHALEGGSPDLDSAESDTNAVMNPEIFANM